MTFSHDDIRDRLVDHLYGQLEGEAHAAFQAHLDTCAACHDEVSGAERARMVAREVVRRPLGDAVPERVRARAFEAARAAVAVRPPATPGRATAAQRTPVGEGWFSRLRRRWTWTFPTFATVAAMAVFLLVRATIFREAKTPVSAERARELAEPAPASPVAPAAASRPPSDESGRYGVKAPHVPAASRNREAPPQEEGATTASAAARASKNGTLSDLPRKRAIGAAAPAGSSGLNALSSGSRGAGAAQPALAAPKAAPPKAAPPKAALRKATPHKAAASDADEFGGIIDEERAPTAPNREFAAPPPPPAPAAAAAAKGGAPSMMDLQDDAVSAPEAEKKADKKSKTNKDKEPSAHRAEADEAPPERAAAGKAADRALARGSRAESLMNQRRWGEAITILRDLLRRYPSHPAAPRWRALLNAAQAGLDAPEEMFATPPPPR